MPKEKLKTKQPVFEKRTRSKTKNEKHPMKQNKKLNTIRDSAQRKGKFYSLNWPHHSVGRPVHALNTLTHRATPRLRHALQFLTRVALG